MQPIVAQSFKNLLGGYIGLCFAAFGKGPSRGYRHSCSDVDVHDWDSESSNRSDGCLLKGDEED